ncbi:MAG: hypothetical protein ACD_48C00626G0003 [uncultured bacterium]|nr:MAG: hypothetical protein ACD_48C00626G0003 [uncultured bacterium]
MNTLAQLTIPGSTEPIPYPTGFKFTNTASVVTGITNYVYVISGIVLLVVILSAGFTLLTSAGDAKAMEKGKKGLTNGIVGFVIIFVAYWLVQIAGIVFGIEGIGEIFK